MNTILSGPSESPQIESKFAFLKESAPPDPGGSAPPEGGSFQALLTDSKNQQQNAQDQVGQSNVPQDGRKVSLQKSDSELDKKKVSALLSRASQEADPHFKPVDTKQNEAAPTVNPMVSSLLMSAGTQSSTLLANKKTEPGNQASTVVRPELAQVKGPVQDKPMQLLQTVVDGLNKKNVADIQSLQRANLLKPKNLHPIPKSEDSSMGLEDSSGLVQSDLVDIQNLMKPKDTILNRIESEIQKIGEMQSKQAPIVVAMPIIVQGPQFHEAQEVESQDLEQLEFHQDTKSKFFEGTDDLMKIRQLLKGAQEIHGPGMVESLVPRANGTEPKLKELSVTAPKVDFQISESTSANAWSLARVVAQMSQQGVTSVRLKLHPEQLGEMLVSVDQTKNIDGKKELSVNFETQTHDARNILSESLPELKAALQASDTRLSMVNVNVSQKSETLADGFHSLHMRDIGALHDQNREIRHQSSQDFMSWNNEQKRSQNFNEQQRQGRSYQERRFYNPYLDDAYAS